MSLKIKICNLEFKNPILGASGTFGYGKEMHDFYDINILGSFSTKGTTLNPRFGNPLPRIAEIEGGLINSIGLQNPGIAHVLAHELEWLKEKVDYKVILNIGGHSIADYVECVEIATKNPLVGIIELNVSCPNVQEGGINFGTDEELLKEVVTKVCAVATVPVFVKLTPNVTNIVKMAKICETAGASGLTLINTYVGMRIDINKARPIIANKQGGVSGPCIKPMALKAVYDIYEAVDIPIIGVGGIQNTNDVIEMMMAGASLVQIGSQNLIDPYICATIIEELETTIQKLGYQDINEIIGIAHHNK